MQGLILMALLFTGQAYGVDFIQWLENQELFQQRNACGLGDPESVDVTGAQQCLQETCQPESLLPEKTFNQKYKEIMATTDPMSDEQVTGSKNVVRRLTESAEVYSKLFKQKTLDQWADELTNGLEKTHYCFVLTNLKHFSLVPDGNQKGKYNIYMNPDLTADEAVYKDVMFIAQQLKKSRENDILVNIQNENIPLKQAIMALTTFYGKQVAPTDRLRRRAIADIAKLKTATNFNELSSMHYALFDKYSSLLKPLNENPCECVGCAKPLKRLLEGMKIAENLDKTNLTAYLKRLQDARSLSCKTVAWGMKEMTPTPQEYEVFKKGLSQLQDKFSRLIFSKLSTDSKKTFDQKSFLNIAQVTKLDDGYIPNYKAFEETYLRDNVIPARPTLGDFMTRISVQEALPGMFTCNTSLMVPSDRYDIGSGRVFFSPYSVKKKDLGILAHEFAHWLTYEFKREGFSTPSGKKYTAIRKCIANLHGPVSALDSDSLWTEEDMADQIAGYLMEDSGNFLCRIHHEYKGLNVGDFGLTNSYNEISLVPTANKAYSPGLWRILNIRVASGKALPPSCEVALAEQGSKAPKSCMNLLSSGQ